EIGLLKTGKEADAHLIERRLRERHHLLVSKHYRSSEHRSFRNDAAYRAGRSTGLRRDDLAIAAGSRAGMQLRAKQWAGQEFRAMRTLYEAGVRVPYPVSYTGDQLKMEYFGDRESPAPRLSDIGRRAGVDFPDLWQQCTQAIRTMTACNLVHADLSPYNMLLWEGELIIIDLPQSVEIGINFQAMEFLRRDVENVATYFTKRGVECDVEELFADSVSLVPWL
ncbi:MAG TPA: RIO1 family regulatory kinase/ATPase, partial [Mycobacteriales bacterium]|nr:RIO1 family regulatory kinase/ATPase [Mycobacteriales bacterium]